MTGRPAQASLVGVVVLTAALATALQLLARALALFPYTPRAEELALSLLSYVLSLVPALVVARLGARFAGLARLLLGVPFGLLLVSLLFAGGHTAGTTVVAAALMAFPAGICLRRVGARTLAAGAVLCVVLGVSMRLRSPRVAPAAAPSVLFVVLDTTATGHLSAYGYGKPTSVTLEALARRSLVYRRAVSPASWTIPAHGSMFSGLFPSELGFDGVLTDPQRARGSLAGDLEESGRAAYAISANPLLAVDPSLSASYRALWQGDRLTRPIALHLIDRLRSRKEFLTRGDEITDLALDWLDRLAPRGRPWFLFLNYIDPHIPYDPPRRERDEFAPGIDPGLLEQLTQPYATGKRPLTTEVVSAMRELYDGEVAAMDRALGRLLEGLERRGYDASNLLIVVTADHGEALGEHGLVGHFRGLPDCVLHVPLLVSGPGIVPAAIAAPVQTVQLRATIRALLGLPPLTGIAPALPPWGVPPPLLITEHPEPRWYLDELHTWNAAFDVTPWAGNWVAAERDGKKVVFDDRGRGTSYNLLEDPAEDHPLPLTDGAPLTQAYAAWRRGEWNPVRPASPEVRRALESLGYVR